MLIGSDNANKLLFVLEKLVSIYDNSVIIKEVVFLICKMSVYSV